MAAPTRSLAEQSYNPKLKVFMKKGGANFRFAARNMSFAL
jgi:hypothetical protein